MAGKTRRRRRNRRRRGNSDLIGTSNGSTEGFMIPASGVNLQWLPQPEVIYRWAYEVGAPITFGDYPYYHGGNHPGFLPQNEWCGHSFTDMNGQIYSCSVMHTCPSPCIYYPSNYGHGHPCLRYSSSYMTSGFTFSGPMPQCSAFPQYHQQSFGPPISRETSTSLEATAVMSTLPTQVDALASRITLAQAPMSEAESEITDRADSAGPALLTFSVQQPGIGFSG